MPDAVNVPSALVSPVAATAFVNGLMTVTVAPATFGNPFASSKNENSSRAVTLTLPTALDVARKRNGTVSGPTASVPVYGPSG